MIASAQHRPACASIKAMLARAALLAALLLLVQLGSAVATERRVALVVGNAQYRNANLVLTNPKNDAQDVAAALRELGFDVMDATDVTKQSFDSALAQFARKATGADVALFYYAGHALQYESRNYLLPVEAELEDDLSIRYQMVSVDDVRDALVRAAGVKIMILDACRNNPLAEKLQRIRNSQGRSVMLTRGLARIDRSEGIVVSYATAADQIAMDGGGRNSPYTTALLKRLKEPGLEIEIMFRRIAADVNAQTHGTQRPETYVSLISEFYLNQKDRIAWEGIRTADDVDVLRNFIETYPQSLYMRDAQTRLRAVEQAARDRQAAAERAQREAAAARELEAQRLRIAALEREEKARAEREARKRADDEERAKAAEAERLLKQDVERARIAALERQRAEQEALRQKQETEQRAKAEAARVEAAKAEAARMEAAKAEAAKAEAAKAEAARKLQEQEQERARLAALERERLESEAAQRQAEQRAKAEAEQKLREQAAERARLAALERERAEQAAKAATAPVQPAAATPDACKQEELELARLRAAPEAAEIVKFEREMTCARLRAQVARLRESVGIAESVPVASAQRAVKPTETPLQQQAGIVPVTPGTPAPLPPQAAAPSAAPTVPAAPPTTAPTAMPTTAPAAPAAVSPERACEDEAHKLAQLRASRSPRDIAQFIKDLRCEKLRQQAVRLGESVGVK